NQHYYIYLYPIVPILFVWTLQRALDAVHAPSWSSTAVVGAIAAVQSGVMLAFLAYVSSADARDSGASRGYYAYEPEVWDARIERASAAVRPGEGRRPGAQAALAQRLAACPGSLRHVDAGAREPQLEPFGHARVEATGAGIVVRGASGADMVALPEFPLPAE